MQVPFRLAQFDLPLLLSYRWEKEKDLSTRLVALITENKEIRRNLYPGPNETNLLTAKGGGTAKTDYYWQLALGLFKDHPVYGPQIVQAIAGGKGRGKWEDKIKNRLDKMALICRDCIKDMGETGAGIEREDQIDMSLDNEFTNMWTVCRAKCPYFFEMRALIGQRPNITPVGVGNSTTDLDLSVAGAPVENKDVIDVGSDVEAVSPRTSSPSIRPRSTSPSDVASRAQSPSPLDTDSEDSLPEIISVTKRAKMKPPKCSRDDVPVSAALATKKHKTLNSSSVAASKTLNKVVPKKFKGMGDFADAAQSIEESHKRELELAKVKVDRDAQVKLAREKTKMKEMELKFKLKQEKMALRSKQQEEQNKMMLRMMELKYP
ncbi:hypothetical protein PM082_010039 [Marasmius tenuissimus]|nr:hypothetical protein PM082_010039 [Marasmius tenuissimus]